MRELNPLETAVMFWAGGDPAATLAPLKEIGLRCGQLGIPGNLNLACAPAWRQALQDTGFDTGFRVYTVFAAYDGESYADIPTVQRTVGFVPSKTRREREHRTLRVSDFAAEIGSPGIATHIGMLPENTGDPEFIAIRDLVRRICDHAAGHDQTFALETGQESAQVLGDFLVAVDRPNLGINFDPANMILYGSGDPIEALGILGKYVFSVHCKDGDGPPSDQPGALGEEKPLGAGSVGISRYLAKLRQIGYRGPVAIEREGCGQDRWLADVKAAVRLLAQSR